MFDYDATNVPPSAGGQGKILPKGWYTFEILSYTTNDGSKTYPLEGYTKENNYPKVDLLLQVVGNDEYKDCKVFHTVTFMPEGKEGAGISTHFLKTINQPYEGKIKIDTDKWVGERLMGFAVTDEYKGKIKNKLGEIKPVLVDPQAPSKEKEDLPF